LSLTSFFLYQYSAYLSLHSFPTRRSSDSTTKQFLPIQLTGEKKQGNEGFVKGNDGNYYFYDLAGNMVKNTFIEDSVGNWYFNKGDRKSTRLNSSHVSISYAVFCLKKKNLT